MSRIYSTTGLEDSESIHFAGFLGEQPTGTVSYKYLVEYLDANGNVIPNVTDLSATDFYTIENGNDSLFGAGWWVDDFQYLIVAGDKITWIQDGNGGTRIDASGSSLIAPPGISGEWQYTSTPPLYTYTSHFGETYEFKPVLSGAASDPRYLISASYDANDNKTQFVYEDVDNDGVEDDLVRIIDPVLRETTLSYSLVPGTSYTRLTGITQFANTSAPRTTNFTYYPNGLREKMIEPAVWDAVSETSKRPETVYTYNTNALLETITNPRGDIKSFVYDAFGSQLRQVTNFDGSVYKYHSMMAQALGNETLGASVTTALPAVTDDRFVAHEENERGYAVTRTTDTYGYITSEVDGAGNLFAYDRSEQGRVTKFRRTVMTFDESTNSSVLAVAETQYEYYESSLFDLENVTDPEASGLTHFTYNSIGRVTEATDQIGRKVHFEYGQTGIANVTKKTVVMSTDPLDDLVTEYDYTTPGSTTLPAGQILSQVDPLDRETIYSYYDGSVTTNNLLFGRLKSITLPSVDGSVDTINYSYEVTSSQTIVTETDALQRVTKRYYDALERLVRVEEPDPLGGSNLTVTSYGYDLVGNLISVVDAESNETLYEYDGLGRVGLVIQSPPDSSSPSPQWQYTYDRAGNRIAQIDPLNRLTSYQYDPANRLIAVIEPDVHGGDTTPWTNPVNRFDVNADGRVTMDEDHQLIVDFLGTVTAPFAVPPIGANVLPRPYPYVSELADLVYYLDADADGDVDMADANAVETDVSNTLSTGTPDYNDALGRPVTMYAFDPAGNLISETDPNGHATKHYYDLRGNRVRTEQPLVLNGPSSQNEAPVLKYGFDLANQLTSMTDARGQTTNYYYDGDQRLIAMVQPDVDGIVALRQNPLGAFDVNNDGLVNLNDVADWNDWNSNPSLFADVNGDTVIGQADLDALNDFIATGHVAAGVLNGRPATRYVYDQAGNLTHVVDPMFSVTEFGHDARDRRIFTIGEMPTGEKSLDDLTPTIFADLPSLRPHRPVTEYVYDDADRVTGMTDPLGHVTTWQYDDLDRVTDLLLPDPDPTIPSDQPMFHWSYDAVGNVLAARDGELKTTTYEYDNLYRRTKMIQPPVALPAAPGSQQQEDPVSPLTVYKYDAAGQMTRITDPMNRETNYWYDDLGRLERLDMPAPGGGAATRYELYSYDLVGNRLTQQDAMGATSSTPYKKSWSYDALNRVTQELDENHTATNNTAISFTHDLASNLYSLTDANQNKTIYSHDALNRVTSETQVWPEPEEPDRVRSFTYDLRGNRITETDRNDRVRKYEYDNLHRNKFERWFNFGETTPNYALAFTYDLNGNVDGSQDLSIPSANSAGPHLYFNYAFVQDGLDRAKTMTQLITGIAPSIELQFGYNRMNYRTQLSAKIDAQQDFVTDVTFDALYRATKVTQQNVPGGAAVSDKQVDMNYDLDGQLAWMVRWAGVYTNGQNSPAVATTRYVYDAAGRLDRLDHYRGITTTKNTWVTGYNLDWDGDDRLTKFAFTHGMFTGESINAITYDKRDQLTVADWAARPDENYAYDTNGNRTSSHRHATYDTGSFNQLTSDGTYGYEYDQEGNRKAKNELDSLNDGTYLNREEYTWDHRNRLTQVKQFEAGVVVETVSYVYDSFNQLIRRTETNGTTTTNRFFVLDRVPASGSASAASPDGLTRVWSTLGSFEQTAFSSGQTDQVLSSALAAPDDLGQIVMQFDATGSDAPQHTHRYLWGPGVDFVLADELLPASNGDGDTRVVWPLVDHLGTVRDLVEYVEYIPGNPRTILQKHRMYDTFGNILSEFNRGDLNNDGQYTAADVDILLAAAAMANSPLGPYQGLDINGDGVVNQADVVDFITDIVGSVMGDANFDGWTDGQDFIIWSTNKFLTGNYGWAGADFNGDGTIDGLDFDIWNTNKYTGDGQLNTRVLEHIFGYTGRMFDSATGLQNNLHRWLDPQVGRWISEDPIGFAGGDANVYRYVKNHPVEYYDPTGLNTKGKKGIHQERYYIRTRDGRVYEGVDATHFYNDLEDMRRNGRTADEIILKGHGNDEGIYDPNGDPYIESRGKRVVVDDEDGKGLLRDVTDESTDISLRGCSTKKAARNLEGNLDGADVAGSPIPVFGIPGTKGVIGPVY